MADISIIGRKTFFIAPDMSVIPASYLAELFSSGYEAYVIGNEKDIPLQTKIQCLITAYPGAVLLFCVDSVVAGVEWKSYIKDIQKAQGSNILLGVLYAGNQTGLNAAYGFLQFGCIQLGADCIERIKALLAQYSANGRRSMIRANCDARSTFSFDYKGKHYIERILDVNRSYFACDFGIADESPQLYEQIHNGTVHINGLEFATSAVLIMKSIRRGVNLHIFMFIQADGTASLDTKARTLLDRKIYQIVTESVNDDLRLLFKKQQQE